MSSPSAKACFSAADVGDMGEQAQLDLAVVGRDQLVAGARRRRRGGSCGLPRCGPECSASSARTRRAARSSSRPARRRCGRDRVRGLTKLGQRVGIGRLELGELAPVENARRQFVALLGQIVEHARRGRPGAGRGLLAAGQAHLAEQDVAELLGRAEIERRADERAESPPRSAPCPCANSPDRRERISRSIEDAAPFHPRQRHDQRALQRLVDRRHALGDEARLQQRATAATSRRRPRRRIGSPCRSARARSR